MVRVWDEALKRWVFQLDPAFEGRAVAELLTRSQYNIAPSLRIPILASTNLVPIGPVVYNGDAALEARLEDELDTEGPHTNAAMPGFAFQAAKWGFPRGPGLVVNTRIESVDSPMWASAFRESPCVIPATGFYEWRQDGKKRTPFFIKRSDGLPMLFGGAAAWRTFKDTTKLCASVVTTEPSEAMRALHDRMPVILEEKNVAEWLSQGPYERRGLSGPNSVGLDIVEVGPAVNDARTDGGPALLKPVAQKRLG